MALKELEVLSTFFPNLPLWLIFALIIWSLIWKGFALWKSAKLNSKIWFVIILLINTVGILEILYIFLFSEMNRKKVQKKKK